LLLIKRKNLQMMGHFGVDWWIFDDKQVPKIETCYPHFLPAAAIMIIFIHQNGGNT